MSNSLSLLMVQINPTVGAIKANADKIIDIIQTYQHDHDVIIFPELVLTGYPPEDLLLRDELYSQINAALQTIQAKTNDCHVIIGHPTLEASKHYNAASVITKGQRIALYHKQHLPNYGVFDEERYFTHGEATPCVFTIKNQRIGLCICEDIWVPGPFEQLLEANADLMISINASPFDHIKYPMREAILRNFALRGMGVIYVNQVGGQDELVFDGLSLALDCTGKVCARSPVFTEHVQTVTVQGKQIQGDVTPLINDDALVYQALICGLRDYVEKNNFPGVILGLSGGIDSALTLAIAVDALGASRVHAVMMPSRYTAAMSVEDAKAQALAMKVNYTNLSIEPAFNALLSTLAPSFSSLPPDITEENIQARIRGLLLMALSNKTGNMLLTTSNKSETAVGYCTLYGDMAGGFAVIKDVLKTTVYALAKYRNSLDPVIPERVLTRPPSAELASNQTDQDSLSDYGILDAIISNYMDKRLSINDIVLQGFNPQDVTKVVHLIKRNEYKRRQAPPGVKITTCAFGRDWRYPITSSFAEMLLAK